MNNALYTYTYVCDKLTSLPGNEASDKPSMYISEPDSRLLRESSECVVKKTLHLDRVLPEQRSSHVKVTFSLSYSVSLAPSCTG